MNDKTDKSEVLTTRVEQQTRQWIDHLSQRMEMTKSSFLEKVILSVIARVKCCDNGPYACDHLWCDWCGGWSKDTGGMDPDTEEAYLSCGHPYGVSRTDTELLTPARPTHVDPFRIKTFRQFMEDAR